MQSETLARHTSVHPHVRGDDVPSTVELLPGEAVHPHVRGEYPIIMEISGWRTGSPPRAWGQPHPVAAAGTWRGSPPRAWGQLACRRAASVRMAVHPHVRGDDHSAHAARRLAPRFTPTCVGTTTFLRCNRCAVCTVHPHVRGDNAMQHAAALQRSAVHPHVRGDNAPVTDSNPGSCGSPPRAWGQRC